MDKNSTQFLTFNEIDIYEIDLFADAFGFDQFNADVENMLARVVYKPDDKIVMRLLTDL